MHIELTPQQRNVLVELVAEALDEMGPEIHHTWRYEYRAELKQRRSELQKIRELLSPAEQLART